MKKGRKRGRKKAEIKGGERGEVKIINKKIDFLVYLKK
jgi:hypothetical protein